MYKYFGFVVIVRGVAIIGRGALPRFLAQKSLRAKKAVVSNALRKLRSNTPPNPSPKLLTGFGRISIVGLKCWHGSNNVYKRMISSTKRVSLTNHTHTHTHRAESFQVLYSCTHCCGVKYGTHYNTDEPYISNLLRTPVALEPRRTRIIFH